MNIRFSECEIKQNQQHGVQIIDWWKGMVTFESTLIADNLNSGLKVKNIRVPMPDQKITTLQTNEDEQQNTSRGLIEPEDCDLVLGKIWILYGTEISKNDTGISLLNCVYYIDENFKTNIFDNL